MKFLPLILLSLFAAGACTSDQQKQEDVIQKDEDIQMQQEELQRTGRSDDIGPGYTGTDGSNSIQPAAN